MLVLFMLPTRGTAPPVERVTTGGDTYRVEWLKVVERYFAQLTPEKVFER